MEKDTQLENSTLNDGTAKIGGLVSSCGLTSDYSDLVARSNGYISQSYNPWTATTYEASDLLRSDNDRDELESYKNNVLPDLANLSVSRDGLVYSIPKLNNDTNTIRTGYYSWSEAIAIVVKTSGYSCYIPPGYLVMEFDDKTEWDPNKFSMSDQGIARFLMAGAKCRYVQTLQEAIKDPDEIRRAYFILEQKYKKVKAAQFKVTAGTI